MAFVCKEKETSARQRSRSPPGSRRWPWGRYSHDMKYYTFAEWLVFVQQQGFTEDRKGNKGYEAIARDLWSKAVDQDTEQRQYSAWVCRSLADDVGALEAIGHDELLKTQADNVAVVLESRDVSTCPSTSLNSLRMFEDGTVDLLGGAGKYALLTLKIVEKEPSLQVRFQSNLTADFLQFAGGTFSCAATGGTIFEFLPRATASALPIYLVCCKGESNSIGTFMLRRAPPMHDSADACMTEPGISDEGISDECTAVEQPTSFARELVKNDPSLTGRRCFANDYSGAYYDFPEFVQFVTGQDCPAGVEIDYAKAMWVNSHVHWCTLSSKVMEMIAQDANLQGKRCWILDKHGAGSSYTFDQFANYVYLKGWGGILAASVLQVTRDMWENSNEPWQMVEVDKSPVC